MPFSAMPIFLRFNNQNQFPLSGSSHWPIHSSNAIYHSGKGDQSHGSGMEYKDPDDWLISNTELLGNPYPHGLVSGLRVSFQLCRITEGLGSGSGQTHHRKVTGPGFQNPLLFCKTQLISQAFPVLDGYADCNEKPGVIRSSSHETHTMISKEQLAHSRVPEKA